MRVTSKGQVTIPKAIREKAGFSIGSEVEFRIEDGAVVIRRSKGRNRPGMSRGEKLVESIRGTATRKLGLSTDEIMKLLRGDD
jgi:AbrB family looped-hinge helix DNA binding protein